MVGLDCISSCRVPGLQPPSICHLVFARVPYGELVGSFGMDITLDNVLTILDKHYNNMKALDALNQELLKL